MECKILLHIDANNGYEDIVYVYGFCDKHYCCKTWIWWGISQQTAKQKDIYINIWKIMGKQVYCSIKSHNNDVLAPLNIERQTNNMWHFNRPPLTNAPRSSQTGNFFWVFFWFFFSLDNHNYQHVQNLLPNDTVSKTFEWFSNHDQTDEYFAKRILWIDETNFTKKGIFNQRKIYV